MPLLNKTNQSVPTPPLFPFSFGPTVFFGIKHQTSSSTSGTGTHAHFGSMNGSVVGGGGGAGGLLRGRHGEVRLPVKTTDLLPFCIFYFYIIFVFISFFVIFDVYAVYLREIRG